MILKALYDYYQRDSESIPFGLQKQPISFIVVINENGKFVNIEDCRQGNQGTNYLVPIGAHSNGSSPLLFWDNVMYLLDYIPEMDKTKPNKQQLEKINKAHVKHKSFVERCDKVAKLAKSNDLIAVSNFYKLGEIAKVYKHDLWDTIKSKTSSCLSFRIQGSTTIVAENEILLKYNNENIDTESSKGRCLITGKYTNIVRLCANTPIAGSKNSAKLVSFNDNSFCSYNKEQGENSPISVEAEFAFSSVLKKFIAKDSRNKFLIGNRTFVFWASSNNEAGQKSEDCLFNLFTFNDVLADNPDQGVEQVRKVFEAIYSGVLQTSLDDKFYILGLAPNSARIAVAYWAEIPLKDFAERIIRHFNDMQVFDDRKDKKPYMGLYAILSAVTLGGKVSDVTPNLPEATAKSIFEGTQYPYPLYSGCIRRIRAEQSLTITRVAIIKAYLNRLNNNEQKIKIMLDNQNTNQGYLCGRLFAVLDKIQHEAKDQHSIKERYMNAASSTPSSVFSTILNLSSHHSKKLDKGLNKFYEELKEEIIDKIGADGFPSHLDLQDQGRFFVGFYHQQKAFYTKKEEQNESNNN